jgi:REP element-mobilizing transposase RayT
MHFKQIKYRSSTLRLQNWDYRSNGGYFVTLCSHNKKCCFGKIINDKIHLSFSGVIAHKRWSEVPEHFSFVELGEFIVMPNHIHGIIVIKQQNNTPVGTRNSLVQKNNKLPERKLLLGKHRFQNQGKGSLSTIIGSYKSIVTKNIRQNKIHFSWQPRFYEHIIRTPESFNNISEYIINNPSSWKTDRFNK